ncbi:class I fructose-bisphosphate aldolase [Paraburkholderia diazotrophica]|uniref:class I fructose-bisphosphate aldolase n=1 Tax=Paraburkholderia diazotrophica TaxID=667676 RepID=UPI001FE5B3B3|nr:aldolase [Paraburkholderia diazotrophica]
MPIDHGLTLGPVPGIDRPDDMADWLADDLITGLVVHKGIAERLGSVGNAGVMIHLNGTMSLDAQPDRKVLLTRVDAAMRLGADGVSVQTNFCSENVGENLRILGAVVDDAHEYGLPIMVMLYDKTGPQTGSEAMARMRHFVRAAVELGVDAIKLGAPPDLSSIGELIDGVQAHTSVVFAGGDRKSDEQLLALARAAVEYGARGLCVGRNVFQHGDPRRMLQELRKALGMPGPRAADGGCEGARGGACRCVGSSNVTGCNHRHGSS